MTRTPSLQPQPAAKKGCLTCLQSTCVVCPWRTQKAQQQPDAALVDSLLRKWIVKAMDKYPDLELWDDEELTDIFMKCYQEKIARIQERKGGERE